MLIALDLTARQAARVLAQAVQSHAKLEIEPRPDAHSSLLWGSLATRNQEVLVVELHPSGPSGRLGALLGAECDVRTMLSGQLCLFATFIVDVVDQGVPQRIMLAVPDTIQVANRRRFARQAPTEPVPVRITVPGTQPPFVAILTNIGPQGLACRTVSRDLDQLLFIGDDVELEFVLPWCTDVFKLSATACNKSPGEEEGHLVVGFEFVEPAQGVVLGGLRAALHDEAARLVGDEE